MPDLVCVADDGIEVTATVVGRGRPLVLLAGGIDYRGAGWDRTAALLADRHRVIRFIRRFYRPELGDPFQWTMADEARDVAALARELGEPAALLGHSSGGVLALECLIRDPERFRAAIVFEAPIVTEDLVGGAALARARRDVEDGRLARSMTTFFRDVVGMPAVVSRLSAVALTMVPQHRARIPGQVADLAAIDSLGDRRREFARIAQPVLGIMGSRSPEHLRARMRALLDVVPNHQTWLVAGGHGAQQKLPQEFADRVSEFLSSADGESHQPG